MRYPVIALLWLLPAWSALGAPPPTETPATIDELLYVRPFRLDEGFRYHWSAGRPLVTEGTILVLDVEPDLVSPRETTEPVLYVGAIPAQRVNRGHPTGRLIAIVPGHVDLTVTPVWFGTPDLPERIDAGRARAELDLARRAGIEPAPTSAVEAARGEGGKLLRLADARSLNAVLLRLYERWVLPLR